MLWTAPTTIYASHARMHRLLAPVGVVSQVINPPPLTFVYPGPVMSFWLQLHGLRHLSSFICKLLRFVPILNRYVTRVQKQAKIVLLTIFVKRLFVIISLDRNISTVIEVHYGDG